MFLDIDRCVYVIACDYSVVAAGLIAKFGVSEAHLKGKSFFDKIIQVPFKMPTRQYQVHKYIEQLLRRIGVDPDGERDVERYRELVEQSVGFNPRTMKRLLNTLQLLTILKAKRQERGKESRTDPSHACRLTFAILCMLERYEAIYEYLTAEKLSAERLEALQGGLRNGEEFADIRLKIAGRTNAGNAGERAIDGEVVRNASEFVDTFVDCLKKDVDAELSDEKIRHLEEILSMSVLVSAGRQLHEFVPRQFALQLRWDLNERYSSFVGGQNPQYNKFRMDRGTVWLGLPKGVWWMRMGRKNETYYFDVRSPKNADALIKLGRLICERLNWGNGTHGKIDDEHFYRFFAQSAKAPRALEDYQKELFRRLDELTKQREVLAETCALVSDG